MGKHENFKNSQGIKERGHNKSNRRGQNIMKKAMEAASQLRSESRSLGSYTGTAHDGDIPVQDADDL